MKTTFKVTTGIGKRVLVTKDSLRTKHVLTLQGLRPATGYSCLVAATPAKGKSAGFNCGFTTVEAGPAELTTQSGKLYVGGRPSFVLKSLVTGDCPDMYAENLIGLRMNVIAGYSPACGQDAESRVERIHAAFSGRAWWQEYQGNDFTRPDNLPELLGIKADIRTSTAVLVPYLLCDSNPLINTYEMIRAKRRTPVVTAFPISRHPVLQKGSCLDSQRVAAAFWTVFVAEGDGIEASTVSVFPGRSERYDVSEAVSSSWTAEADLLYSLAPALLMGKTAVPAIDERSAVKLLVKQYAGTTYIIAVNTGGTPSTLKASWSKFGNQSFRELRAGGTLRAKGGTLVIRLSGLGVGIYRAS